MREFQVAVGRAAVAHSDEITFKLGDHEITAKAPTAGQLALFLDGGNTGGLQGIRSLVNFLSDLVDDRSWAKVEELLHDGLDVNVLNEVANYLIGEWSGRPTMPSPDSSPTPTGTGRKSTEKQASQETPSNSLSTASAT